jgi:hypothetical protein
MSKILFSKVYLPQFKKRKKNSKGQNKEKKGLCCSALSAKTCRKDRWHATSTAKEVEDTAKFLPGVFTSDHTEAAASFSATKINQVFSSKYIDALVFHKKRNKRS